MRSVKKWFVNFVELFFPSIAAYKTNDKEVIEYIENNTVIEKNCMRICNMAWILILLPWIGCRRIPAEYRWGLIINLLVSILLGIATIWVVVKVKRAQRSHRKGILANKPYFQKLQSHYWMAWCTGMMIIGFVRLNTNMDGTYLYLTQLALGFLPLLTAKKFKKVAIFTFTMAVLLTINLLCMGLNTEGFYMLSFILTNMVLVFVGSFLLQRLNLSINVMTSYIQLVGFMDPLTGALNRRGFQWRKSEMMEGPAEVGVMMIDIDFFKLYNDTYGHVHGDEILVGIVKTLKQMLDQEKQSIVRFGGEEFVVLCFNDTRDHVIQLAYQIHKAIGDLKYESADPLLSEYLTVSIGVDYYKADPDAQLDDMVAKADEALYHAKNYGRNQVVVWTEHRFGKK